MAEGFFRAYRAVSMSEAKLREIAQIAEIIESYQARGMVMSVRQVYYQLVARDLIPNTQRSYDRLQGLVNDGRLAGMISWTAIEDRNRQMMSLRTYLAPQEAVREVKLYYRRDLWAGQPWRPTVLVEKAALEGVVSTICAELRVDFMSTRGYNSQSETWRLGTELARLIRAGQRPIVFHLGDHDPSGLDMTEDLRGRLEMFAGTPITLQRLALNMDQVERYDPPPNPAKTTDSRFDKYRRRFGDESWELDALEPTVIHDLIRDAVDLVRDPALWSAALAGEADDRDTLDLIVEGLA